MKLQKVRDVIGKISDWINYIGLASLFVMVFIVAIDVIMRKVSGSRASIKGSNELTVNLMVFACVLGIPVLQHARGHVWVNLLVDKFPRRMRSFWMFAITLLETVVIAMLIWGAYRNVADLLKTKRSSDVLDMPLWIFAVSTIVAFAEYFLLSLCDTLQHLIDGVKNNAETAEELSTTEQ